MGQNKVTFLGQEKLTYGHNQMNYGTEALSIRRQKTSDFSDFPDI